MPADSGRIRILWADSDGLRSQMLADGLRRRRDFTVHGCAMDSDVIDKTFPRQEIDVAVICSDRRGPESCLAAVRRIHLIHPNIATVLLAEALTENLVVNAFRSGARGVFCHSEADFRELCKCIRRVHEGQIWANSQQVRCLLNVLTQVPSLRVLNASGDHLLTAREEQVVALVADGLSNRQIAAELRLSEHTIKKYLFRIFDKVGISTRVELVLYAVRNGNSREAEWIPGS